MAHAVADQQLLYALRSPTTPLDDKVQHAVSALDAEPASTSLPPLVRDWALDYLVRATRSDAGEAALRSAQLWSLAARTTEASPSTPANTPPLPIFVAFVEVYSSHEPSVGLLRGAAAVWARLAAVAMRKATVDSALEGYEKFVAASLRVFSREQAIADAAVRDEELALWEDLGVNWLKPLRSMVLDAGKGGKKIPAHTLSLLPSLLPLLARLSPASRFRRSLLETIQLAIFNVENLKRGLARDSYAAGSAEQSVVSTADSELLAALSTHAPSVKTAAFAALPYFTAIYASALAAHSAVLFPLPAKANFPTPSAQKSALEVLGLTKRRELAGRWVKGVAAFLGWSQPEQAIVPDATSTANEKETATALAGVLEVVETADLYRPGQAEESWSGVLAQVVDGAVRRLEQSSQSADHRDALVGVLALVSRLDHTAVGSAIPRVLAVLARTASALAEDQATTAAFLADLVTFHSRSVSLPTFLSLISDALASTSSTSAEVANNLLTTHAFAEQLGRAVSGMTGASSAVRATWENLVVPVRDALKPVVALAGDIEEAAPSPSKKRKLSSSAITAGQIGGAAARLRIATLLVRNVPASALPSLVDPLKVFVEEVVDSRLKDFAKSSRPRDVIAGTDADGDIGTPGKKDKKRRRKSGVAEVANGGGDELDPEARLGVELLELRYAVLERLNREGLLEGAGEDGEKWWEVRAKRRDGLREVVESGVGEAAVEAVRTLFQHFELTAPSDSSRAEAQSVIAALLVRIGTPAATQGWSGFLRGLQAQEVPVALWELAVRRWLPVINVHASDDQLKQIASLVTVTLSSHSPEYAAGLSFASSTHALLQRADFWELARLQAHLQRALLDLVTLPSLAGPTSALSVLFSSADEKTASALRSLRLPTLLSVSRQFPKLIASVPLDYLGKDLRGQLSERALALDIWLSASDELGAGEKEQSQNDLRHFVAAMGMPISNASEVLAQLMDGALPGARDATLALYRSSVIEIALANYKASQNVDELVALAQSFGEKPLQDLAQRARGGAVLDAGIKTREQAFLVLAELLTIALPESATLPPTLRDAVVPAVKNASKALGKAIPSAMTSLQQNARAVLRAADLVEACRVIWLVRDWLATCSDDDASAYAEFSQFALAAALVHLPSAAGAPEALETASAVLQLLSYRVERERKRAKEGETSTELFETLIAAHLALRSALGVEGEDTLDATLARAANVAMAAQYSAALDSLAGLLAATGEAVSPADSISIARFEHALAVAQVLVLNGPEGSSRVASAALSEILRQLALVVEHIDGSNQGAVKIYALAGRFIEIVCGERPLLLSRFNISSVLAIVSHILRHSASSTAAASPAASTAASQLYHTLVNAVAHVVRHRKDHVVPLFPLLISTLSSFLSVLRRAGLGTLGASLDEVDSSTSLGLRAEREARTTFPAWVWAGGAHAIGRSEAKAVGRLLGSLTAKTTTTTAGKRKHGAADDASTNTSLAAPLSKHAPFLLLNYLRACVHPTCPIPSALRTELQGGWFEVMDAMGKWEREALMKGMLGEDEEAERGVLRGMWKSWEKERYRG